MTAFMAIMNILAFFTLITLVAYFSREKFVDALPATMCVIILCLCALAYINALALVDYISMFIVAVCTFYVILATDKDRKKIFNSIKLCYCQPSTILIIFCMILMTLCVKDKIITWWDDYNFWATDVKSIFYLDGFAEKYKNVAPEFGDYPPGTQMMKWWFINLTKGSHMEGMMFAGYYAMIIAFMAPMFRNLRVKLGIEDKLYPNKKKRKIFGIFSSAVKLLACGAVIWIYPSVAEVFYLDGCSSDVIAALLYGLMLMAVIDYEGHTDWFYYGRLMAYTGVLILVKDTAFIWVFFGLIFLWLYHLLFIRKSTGRKLEPKNLFCITAMPVLTGGTWLVFCLNNRRVAKLTGTAVSMMTGNIKIPQDKQQLVQVFLHAFFTEPLHRWKTIALDVTPFVFVLVIFVSIFLPMSFR